VTSEDYCVYIAQSIMHHTWVRLLESLDFSGMQCYFASRFSDIPCKLSLLKEIVLICALKQVYCYFASFENNFTAD